MAQPALDTASGTTARVNSGLDERASLQTGNFVLVGILVVGFSIGVRRVLQSGRGTTWGPTLLAAAGIGLEPA